VRLALYKVAYNDGLSAQDRALQHPNQQTAAQSKKVAGNMDQDASPQAL
jgi:hypothetical protein